MGTPVTIESADEVALSAMRDHHARLRRDLDQRVADLRSAVSGGAPSEALSALVAFVDRNVVPHLLAEEVALYPAAADEARLELLVDAMVLEHRDIERRARSLASATEIQDVLAAAEALNATFGMHVVCENEVVLPALARAPQVSLATLLRDLQDRLSAPVDRGSSTTRAPEELDVRTIEHRRRHEVIFARLDALAVSETLVIAVDHDPRPLRHQLDAAWPGTFDWDYLDAGPELWRIAITRRR